MTFILKDRVRETTTTTGTGAFTLGGAVSGYRSFSSVMANSDTTWYACVLPGGAWEVGIGTWVTGNTLQRTTLLDSSTGSAISFAAGTKDIFIALPASKGDVQNNTFPANTRLVFQQTNAPIYWTKITDLDNSALRITSGAAGFGGTTGFTSAFTARTVSSTTIATSTMPNHAHTTSNANQGGTSFYTNFGNFGGITAPIGAGPVVVDAIGGGGSHNHTLDMSVLYTDVITAFKN